MRSSSSKHVVIAITLAKPGGATFFAFSLASWLKTQGIKVTMLAGEGTWLFEHCEQASIPCLRLPTLGREIHPWKDLLSLLAITKQLRTLKPDALHLNSSKMGVLGSLAGRLAHVPRIVYCIGGWSFLESVSERTKKIYLYAERWSSSWKDVIVCVHPEDAKEAARQKIRGREETAVIPNGVDLSQLDVHRLSRDDARSKLGVPRDGYIFGTVGNFYPAKDLPRYMEACAIVSRQFPNTHFAFIGDGQERQAIETARATWHLEDRVLLLGSHEEASRYLLAFDSFVLPSAKEGMAFALLEAMGASLPCIVTDVGANRWVLNSTGWIVPAKDPQKLAEALKDAYSNRLQATEKGRNGRQEVETRFPIKATFAAHAKLLMTSVEPKSDESEKQS